MNHKGLLIVISGPSGAGKGTLCKELLIKHKDIQYSVSATTRKPRKGEIDKKNYFFMTEDEFIKVKNNDGFLEWAEVYGNYYGTPKELVLNKLNSGIDVLLEIDIQGALQVKRVFNDGVFIFIFPPSIEELEERIKDRGTETPKDIMKRMKSVSGELTYVHNYDYVVINDNIEKAVNKLSAIIIAEKCRMERKHYHINSMRREDG